MALPDLARAMTVAAISARRRVFAGVALPAWEAGTHAVLAATVSRAVVGALQRHIAGRPRVPRVAMALASPAHAMRGAILRARFGGLASAAAIAGMAIAHAARAYAMTRAGSSRPKGTAEVELALYTHKARLAGATSVVANAVS